MSIRVTPLQAIQSGGLRGFGVSVFIDRDADTPSPETAKQSSYGWSEAVAAPAVVGSPLATRGIDESVAPHSQQARFSSQDASQADPVGPPPLAGSADQFNDTGPHVFSDQEPH